MVQQESWKSLLGKCEKRLENRGPNRLRLGRRGEESGEVRLSLLSLEAPPLSQGYFPQPLSPPLAIRLGLEPAQKRLPFALECELLRTTPKVLVPLWRLG